MASLGFTVLDRQVIDGHGTYVHAADGSYDWRTMIKAGAMSPTPALDEDPDGYAELIRPAFDDILSTLITGRTVT